MSGGRCAEGKDVEPFPRISRDDNLGFEGSREDGTGLLRGSPSPDKGEVATLGLLARAQPKEVFRGPFSPKDRADDGKLASELSLMVSAIAGGLLREGGDSVTDKFV